MTITPEMARGAWLGLVVSGQPFHPAAPRLAALLSDQQLARALNAAADIAARYPDPDELFYLCGRGRRTQAYVSPDAAPLDHSAGEQYWDLDAISAAIVVTALEAGLE